MIELKPMLCDEQKVVPEGPDWVLEQKHDGWRFLFRSDERGDIRSYAGRNGSDRTGQPKAIEEALRGLLVPETVLDCELVSLDPKIAVGTALAKGGALKAIAFDVLELMGTDIRPMKWYERRAHLELLLAGGEEHHSGVGISSVFNEPTGHSVWHGLLVEAGAEGTVSKRRNSRYVPKRSSSWVKVKKTETLEARVIGLKAGENGWAGTIGAFEVELLESGVKTTVGTRGEQQRLEVTASPTDYLGRIMELKHYGLTRDGVPRHPGFVRWREDRE